MAGLAGVAAWGERRPSRRVGWHLAVDRAVGKLPGLSRRWDVESRLALPVPHKYLLDSVMLVKSSVFVA